MNEDKPFVERHLTTSFAILAISYDALVRDKLSNGYKRFYFTG